MSDEVESCKKEVAGLKANLDKTNDELTRAKQERDAALENLERIRITRETYFQLRKEVENIKTGTNYLMWRDVKPLWDKLNELEKRIEGNKEAVK